MKKLTAFLLALLIVFTFCSCKKSANVSETNNSSETNSASKIELDKNEALKTAEELIKVYENYKGYNIGCELEDVTEEEEQAAWNALTAEQQNHFMGSLRKCTCCKTYENALAHTKEHLDDSVLELEVEIENYVVNNDTLYFIHLNRGGLVYSNIRILDFNNKKISAIADCGVSYDLTGFAEVTSFTIEYIDNHFKITGASEFKADPDSIKKYDIDPQVKQSLIDKYGVSSQDQFVSCLGIDINDFPTHVLGVIAIDSVDLDFDGSGEIVLLRISSPDGSNNKQAEVIAEVYTNINNEYVLSISKSIQNISYAAASNIYLYFSEKHGRYCIMIDSFESGTYTGINSGSAMMYGININSIEAYINLTEASAIGANIDFNSQLSNINAPYAKYCTEIDTRNDALYYQPLCEIEHELYGDMGSYLTRNHKLLIKNTLS